MTYNKSLQGRFVAAGYPAATMLVVAALLWLAGGWGEMGGVRTFPDTIGLDFVGDIPARAISLLSYVAAAFILGNLYLFEKRLHWLSPVFLWVVSVMFFLHRDYLTALSVMAFVLVLAQVFYACRDVGDVRSLYGAFALLSFLSLFLLQFIYLLPLFLGFFLLTKARSVRGFFAALLGVITPYWMLWGVSFVFPQAFWLTLPLEASYLNIITPAAISLSPLLLFVQFMECVVWIAALVYFFNSSFPSKPLLRKRLLLFMCLNLYLWLLSWVVPQDYVLLLAWRLPGVAVMASYLFAVKITKFSNILFVLINVLWIIIAVWCLWIG